MLYTKIMSKKFSILSFKYAFEGLVAALKEEPNLKFHFLIGFLVLITSYTLRISKLEWMIVITMIGFVIAVELTNTAIESVVNAFVDKTHPGAKLAKDISAAAVLISSITAAIIGILIFVPYFTQA